MWLEQLTDFAMYNLRPLLLFAAKLRQAGGCPLLVMYEVQNRFKIRI